jgi:hypothetical protein
MTGPIIGQQIKIRPGLRDRPSISGKDAVVTAVENDRLRVNIAGNSWVIERSEIVR